MWTRNFVVLVLVTTVTAVPVKSPPEKKFQGDSESPQKLLMPDMQETFISGPCDALRPHNLTGPTGAFYSPNYPSDYPNNALCTWVSTSPIANGHVMMDFFEFNLEDGCTNDCVRVYDGPSNTAPLLVALSGRHPAPATPPTIFSTQPSLFIEFTSNAANVNTGFAAKYSKDQACGIYGPQFINDSMTINSPYYPTSYAKNMTCTWIYVKPVVNNVFSVIRFHEFNVGTRAADGTCTEAWFDVPRTSGIERVCGSQTGLGVTIPSGNQTFTFHSTPDAIPTSTQKFSSDFDQYTAASSVLACTAAQPDLLSSDVGRFETANYGVGMYTDRSLCTWTMTSSEQNGGIALDFNSIATENRYDYVYVYDGVNDAAPLVVQYTGVYTQTTLPPTVFSSGASLMVKFTSDASVTERGFQAKYTHDTACGPLSPRHVTGCSGSFSSPYYPEYYANNMNCHWQVDLISGARLTVRFSVFNIGTRDAGNQCVDARFNLLEDSTLTNTYCGTNIPTIVSTAATVSFNFDSDLLTVAPTGQGFDATFDIVGGSCPLKTG